MPSTIPYDPSLVLASVVSEQALKVVEQISAAQAPVDAAQDALNSLIASKRSLDFTRTEVQNLGVDTAELDKELEKVKTAISTAAIAYATAKVAAEPAIAKLRSDIRMVHASVETPVDYMKSDIKTMPLAADTMNMDVQYFSMDTNQQDSNAYANAISSYVGASTSFLGATFSTQISAAAQNQVSRQVSNHKIVGTLVLSVACTHKNASVLAPFVIDVDKGIKVWNHLFPDKKLDCTDREALAKLANTSDAGEDVPHFSIISGTTFGSSFVGMVHVLNSTDTSAAESLAAQSSSLQAQMDAGAWFEGASGSFGVNASFANDVKNLLSSQNVTSHVTLLSMGVIPSMVANDVTIAVQAFADFDPAKNMQAVAAIQNATTSDQTSVQQMANASRTGAQANSMRSTNIKASLSALAEIEDGKNKILDINSMMTALDDYLKKAMDGTAGVPINYYLKDIDLKMLAEMWVAKYYPGQYQTIRYDDASAGGPATASGAGAGGDAAAAPAGDAGTSGDGGVDPNGEKAKL